MDSRGNHGVYCPFLACSVALLQSGLQDMLINVHNIKKDYEKLCLLCCKIVLSKEEDIFSSILNLKSNKCDNSSASSPVDVKVASSSSKVHNNFSYVHIGSHGRMLSTLQSISRGCNLLTDKPFVCCLASQCQCHEESLLIEHIAMAVTMKYSQTKDDAQHSHFLNNVHSALNSSIDWSPRQLFTVMLVSALITLFNIRQEISDASLNPNYIQPNPVLQGKVVQQQHNTDCLELFEILVRLPLNVHAVTTLASTEDSSVNSMCSTTLQQVRIGYCLYLSASSVNHSCDPNANIRFQIPPKVSNETSLDQLFNTAIDIVSIDSIDRGAEVTVSYGPLLGTHNVSTRQQLLSSQYLFKCECTACTIELSRLESQESTSSQYSLTKAEGNIEKQQQIEPKEVLDSKLMCEMLIGLNNELTVMQSELSPQFNSKSQTKLIQFEQQRLTPLKKKIQTLQLKYFPEILEMLRTATRNNQITSLCAEFCGILLTFFDIHAHVLALCHKYAPAAALIKSSINLMISCGRYRENDVVIGRERVKLSQLLLSAGDKVNCLVIVRKAMEDLRPCVSDNDPDWMEANSILEYLMH